MLAQVNLPQLREPRAARGWLYTIVRNEYLRRRPLTSAITLDDAPELASAESDPGWLDSELNSDRLQAAIQELPNEFRIPLLMFYFEDRSYRDIADQLGLPQGTVMSRLSRAKTQLRRKLEKFILEPHS
jgi:RNA polymerase sigma-70 factor (ECF subfamily)